MYITSVPNRSSPPAVLLRESYRVGGKVKTRTLANLSKLPAESIEVLRRSLKGETLLPSTAFEALSSRHHGHVDAVLRAMRRLGIASLLGARAAPQRERVMAMLAARIVEPSSKLATTRWWHDTSLPEVLGVEDTDENALYDALDWLLERQPRIEAKLAARHLDEGAIALYDLSSSYFEGHTCPLAALGHNRDGKKGKRQVNYGLLTNAAGVPVSVSVFKGNTADPSTLLEQVDKLRDSYALERVVLVGDRGMITQRQVDVLAKTDGVDWIAALRPGAIAKLLDSGALQMDLFDERNLFEVTHPDFPGERLVACRNHELARRRADKRESLLEATAKELEKVRAMVGRGRLVGQDTIGVRVGKVVNKYRVAKHYTLNIQDDRFDFSRDEPGIAREAALDGVYVVRTSVDAQHMSAEDAVRNYKRLAEVEQAFRTAKSPDIAIRPIRHRTEGRVRAHIFLCMLAYYIQWHMREAWRALLFCDEDQGAKFTRDPVAPASRSAAAMRKVRSRRLDDGTPAHSFTTLLKSLSTIVRNTCRATDAGNSAATFELTTTPDANQQRALDLIDAIRV